MWRKICLSYNEIILCVVTLVLILTDSLCFMSLQGSARCRPLCHWLDRDRFWFCQGLLRSPDIRRLSSSLSKSVAQRAQSTIGRYAWSTGPCFHKFWDCLHGHGLQQLVTVWDNCTQYCMWLCETLGLFEENIFMWKSEEDWLNGHWNLDVYCNNLNFSLSTPTSTLTANRGHSWLSVAT